MLQRAIKRTEGGLEIALHIQPGASRTALAGCHGQRLKLRVQARPIAGQANEAVVRFIAQAAGVARSCVSVVRGAASRDKTVRIECADGAQVQRRIVEAWAQNQPQPERREA